MAGDASVPPQGEKFFNTFTVKGRRNCTVASLGFFTALYLVMKLRPKSKN